MGWHASDTHGLTFSGCRVPEDHLLGERGRGFAQFLDILDEGRIAISALACGTIRCCLEEATAYAKERQAFGRPIGVVPGGGVRVRRHGRALRVEPAADLPRRLAARHRPPAQAGRRHRQAAVDRGGGDARRAWRRRCSAATASWTRRSSRRQYRDAKILEIGEGTSEMQRLVISPGLGLPCDVSDAPKHAGRSRHGSARGTAPAFQRTVIGVNILASLSCVGLAVARQLVVAARPRDPAHRARHRARHRCRRRRADRGGAELPHRRHRLRRRPARGRPRAHRAGRRRCAPTRSCSCGSTPPRSRRRCCRSRATCSCRSPAPAGSSRINNAFQSGGPARLVATINDALDLPVHHYVEIDFQGFRDLVDAVDGVPVYFDARVRDRNSGLAELGPGCVNLDPGAGAGVRAVARLRDAERARAVGHRPHRRPRPHQPAAGLHPAGAAPRLPARRPQPGRARRPRRRRHPGHHHRRRPHAVGPARPGQPLPHRSTRRAS